MDSTRNRWIGLAADTVLEQGGKRVALKAGDVLEVTAESFRELKDKLGWRMVELTPNEVIAAFCELYGVTPLEPRSSIRYVPCKECSGVMSFDSGAVTACYRCGGRGSVLLPAAAPRLAGAKPAS